MRINPTLTATKVVIGSAAAVAVGLGGAGVASAAPVAVSSLFSSSCPYSLSSGEVDGCVVRLQTLLNSKQKAGLTADGVFGNATLTAVKTWQKNHSLTADGLVGPNTKTSLGDHAATGHNAQIVAAAKAIVAGPHIRYVLGGGHGSTPGVSNGGLDCSGFSRLVLYKAYGRDVLGSGRALTQPAKGKITTSPQAGDLVFFYEHSSEIKHVGVYLGGGRMIDSLIAPYGTNTNGVQYDNVSAVSGPIIYAHYA